MNYCDNHKKYIILLVLFDYRLFSHPKYPSRVCRSWNNSLQPIQMIHYIMSHFIGLLRLKNATYSERKNLLEKENYSTLHGAYDRKVNGEYFTIVTRKA